MSIVTVLVGLPGSGKSYILDKFKPDDHNIFVYSTDFYIEQCAIRDGKSYTEVFELYIREATAYMDSALELAIANNMGVMWDQTNTNSKKRKSILARFPASYDKQCFVISPPRNDREWEVLYARLGARVGKVIPGYVIDSMLAAYTEPTLEEGFSKICVMSIMGGIIKQLPELTNAG